MGKDPVISKPPSFARFILWEILGVVGFLHILYYGPANDPVPLIFLANAVIFVLTYPVVYFYQQLKMPVFLKFLISPLHAFLQVLLLISTYIWITDVLYATGYSLDHVYCYQVFADYYWAVFPLFMMNYFFFFQHLWGVSGHEHTFWSTAAILSDAVSGVVVGFGLGHTLDTKWGMFFGGNEVRVLVWVIFVFIGVGVVVWFNARTRKG